MSIEGRQAFIVQNTRLQRSPLVPELQMYLADELMPLWRAIEVELGVQGVAPPFWAFAWVGGLALARYVLDHPHEVAGKRVLDFATGSGLCAIAALKAGAAEVLAVDVDPFAGAAVAVNAAANGVTVNYLGRDLLDQAPPKSDVLLAGDIWYEEPVAARLLAWLRQARQRGTRVLLGDPGRAYFPRDELSQLADYEVPTTAELEEHEFKRAGAYTFKSDRSR
jgi:predicted nicotinamide N-methyase